MGEILQLEKFDLKKIEEVFSVSNTCVFDKVLDGDNLSFKYVVDEEIIGFLICILTADFCEIIDFEVLEKTRRKGFGLAMLKRMILDAKQNGVNDIFLDVDVINFTAINLYKKLGFEQINIRKKYYKKTDGKFSDASVMKLSI